MKSKSNLTAYVEQKSGNRLFTLVIVTWAREHVNRSSVKRNSSNKKEMCRIRALSTNILSIVLKYLCLPGGWEASQSLDKPISHQHILKNQNVFWNFEGSCYTIIVLSAFEVRSSQAAKSKKNTLWWVVAHFPSIACVKVWKARTGFRLIKFVLYRPPCFPAHEV